eukprot:606909-Rhodomonas_salina.1
MLHCTSSSTGSWGYPGTGYRVPSRARTVGSPSGGPKKKNPRFTEPFLDAAAAMFCSWGQPATWFTTGSTGRMQHNYRWGTNCTVARAAVRDQSTLGEILRPFYYPGNRGIYFHDVNRDPDARATLVTPLLPPGSDSARKYPGAWFFVNWYFGIREPGVNTGSPGTRSGFYHPPAGVIGASYPGTRVPPGFMQTWGLGVSVTVSAKKCPESCKNGCISDRWFPADSVHSNTASDGHLRWLQKEGVRNNKRTISRNFEIFLTR